MVIVREGQPIEDALRVFKRQSNAKIQAYREHAYYKTMNQKRRDKALKANQRRTNRRKNSH